jgi:hypothetical protein
VVTIAIDMVGFESLDEGVLQFAFGGSFDGSFTASLVQDSPEGGELIDAQGDPEVSCRFVLAGV